MPGSSLIFVSRLGGRRGGRLGGYTDDINLYQYANQQNFGPIIRLPGIVSAATTTGTSVSGYFVIKEYDGRRSAGGICLTPAITLRFAEALLIYAEAKALETGQKIRKNPTWRKVG